jgi:hypothetical protein
LRDGRQLVEARWRIEAGDALPDEQKRQLDELLTEVVNG